MKADQSLLEGEVWRVIPDFEGRYAASNLGRIAGLVNRASRPGWLIRHPVPSGRGYLYVTITTSEQTYTRGIHTLVLAAFVGIRPDGLIIHHRNNNQMDNRLENLEYVTPRQNSLYAWRDGLMHYMIGERNGNSKLTSEDVILVRQMAEEGHTQYRLAELFGVSQSQIWRIIHRVRWKYVA